MNQPTRTEAIANFLTASTHKDLASLYNFNMEVQVNVAQDGGQRVSREFKGRKWQGYSDGLQTWKPFRIPYKANSDPEYTDVKMSFDLAQHVEGIGMTGWDWVRRRSLWVAYDFDALVGHSEKHLAKLTNEELEAVKEAACGIPWVTIRKSTSGKGLHLYVFLPEVPTANHNEHAALARALLGKMSAITGFDFRSHVDVCGGNMWVWHRKMRGTDGLELVKAGQLLEDVPINWRDHVKVITRKRRKTGPKEIGEVDAFDELSGQRPKINLDEHHKKLIEYLEKNKLTWWWDQDHHMLVTHTIHLQAAHEELGLRGYFKTDSKGNNDEEQNCFGFPLRKGAWTIRRYTPGVSEHASWTQDGSGWTRCYLNREPDLATACRALGGIEDPSGGFEFRDAESAIEAAKLLGVHIEVGTPQRGRRTKLKQHRDGRLVVEVQHDQMDRGDDMEGWLFKKKLWTKMFHTSALGPEEPEVQNYDDLIRKLVIQGQNCEDAGWMIKTEGQWASEPITHVKLALESLGYPSKEVKQILGSGVLRAWRLVNKPFQSEYPGNREWNRNAAQLRYTPAQDTDSLSYPTWKAILEHCGEGLNDAVKADPWCRANGVLTGADYLKIWIASLFQAPEEPLPYLFFYGPEDSGKSSFHESLKLLLTKGYVRADNALQNQSNFNGELAGAILCVIEETDLQRNKLANRKIKDWVTSPDVQITFKGKTPYMALNTMHFVQCDNEFTACPVFPGDTRITLCYVGPLDPTQMIPKKKLIPRLQKEAPDFLAEVLGIEIPESGSRLNVPIISTHEKEEIEKLNRSPLECFLDDECALIPGQMIKMSDLYDRFMRFVDPAEAQAWSKIKFGRALPPQFPKGRRRKDGQHYIGNIWWKGQSPFTDETRRLVKRGDYLEPTDD